jgi:hypothetical protein
VDGRDVPGHETTEEPRGPVAQGIEQQPSKLKVAGSNPAGVATSVLVSSPETWVTERTEDMGDNLVPNGLSMVCKAPAPEWVAAAEGAPLLIAIIQNTDANVC